MARAELQRPRAITETALPRYLSDLQRLVDVDCGSYSKAGVDEVGTWTAGRLDELGASVARHTNTDLGDTIVGTFERDAIVPRTALLAGLLKAIGGDPLLSARGVGR